MNLGFKYLGFLLIRGVFFLHNTGAAFGALINFSFFNFKLFLTTWATDFNFTHLLSLSLGKHLPQPIHSFKQL